MSYSIDSILDQRRILITCGTGGVGKTTLSAALALRATLLGKKTVVVTIDPAKRLANSLGLKTLSDEPTDLTQELKKAYDKLNPSFPRSEKGSLSAIMPDTRHTFESFFSGLSSSKTHAEKLMKNPIFQIFAKEFSGTNEYMALEKLYSIDSLGKYDCIILDTPPSRNTLAFLNAPLLLAQFFDERIIRWLVLPTNKIVSVGMKKALGILEKLTGSGFMGHLFDFASSLFEVRMAFQANLRKITELLTSKDVGFLLVTTPNPETLPELLHFMDAIKEHQMHFDGIALNRTLSYLKTTSTENFSPDTSHALKIVSALQERESITVKKLNEKGFPFTLLPELARDIHSVEDLLNVALAFN